eukprot:m.43599 g.43599  ORF g.43599 m.43599 type:complete len:593 (+) comp8450_c0_seq1:23-1801(+)
MLAMATLIAAGAGAAVLPLGSQPNPPNWPESVAVFSPTDTNIQTKINEAFATNGGHDPPNHGQFSSERYAFLFKPGSYAVDCPVGYYTSVMGLGTSPSDVVFTSPKGVYSMEGDFSIGGALSSFWRSAENFRTSASNKWYVGTGMMWAVSQAAPIRRVVVDNDLLLFEYEPPIPGAGEASGGFFANVQVGGAVKPGSQQQWFARDSTVGNWTGGVWNIVLTGVKGSPPSHCGDTDGTPVTSVPTTPTIAEKPYITVDASSKFSLQIPPVKSHSAAADFTLGGTTAVDFSNVYVTQPTDTAATINGHLAAGLHIVFSPGIYQIDTPLVVKSTGQVLLGLGFATLISSHQNIIISVGNVDGVRIAGLLLQAGPLGQGNATAPTLLEWGTGGYSGSADAPGVISDVFARVGGPDGTAGSPVGADTMFHIRSGHVIIDDTWLWRADHAEGGAVAPSTNRCAHGLVVDGDAVTGYGVAVEHTLEDLTVWNGNGGSVYFYQSELPYDVTQAEFGDPGYCGYRVAPNVTTHSGFGVGVYSFFRDHDVTVASAIVGPQAVAKSFVAPLTVFLNGNGGIQHIVNDQGESAVCNTSCTRYLC